jgi:hypothetical protein
LPVDDAVRNGELQEKREQILAAVALLAAALMLGGFRVPLLLDEPGSRSIRR